MQNNSIVNLFKNEQVVLGSTYDQVKHTGLYIKLYPIELKLQVDVNPEGKISEIAVKYETKDKDVFNDLLNSLIKVVNKRLSDFSQKKLSNVDIDVIKNSKQVFNKDFGNSLGDDTDFRLELSNGLTFKFELKLTLEPKE